MLTTMAIICARMAAAWWGDQVAVGLAEMGPKEFVYAREFASDETTTIQVPDSAVSRKKHRIFVVAHCWSRAVGVDTHW